MLRRIVFAGSTNNFVDLMVFLGAQRPPPLILPCVIVARWFIEYLFIVLMIKTHFFGGPHWLHPKLARCIVVVLCYLYTCLLLTRQTLLQHPGVSPLWHFLHRLIQWTIRSLCRLFRELCKTGLTICSALLCIRINNRGWWIIITVSLIHG